MPEDREDLRNLESGPITDRVKLKSSQVEQVEPAAIGTT